MSIIGSAAKKALLKELSQTIKKKKIDLHETEYYIGYNDAIDEILELLKNWYINE